MQEQQAVLYVLHLRYTKIQWCHNEDEFSKIKIK